jgi:hypothetical protein
MMVGQIVEARRRWPVSELVFLLLAGLMALSAMGNRKDAMPGLCGAGIFAVAAVLRRFAEPARLQMFINDDHLVLAPSGDPIEYDEIRAILSGRAGDDDPDRYPFAIQLDDREIFVPARLNVSSRELEDFLRARMTVVRRVPPTLKSYLEKAVAQFGDERIWWTQGLSHVKPTRTNRGLLTAAIFLLIAGVIGMIVGSSLRREQLAGMSGFAFLVGLISLPIALMPASRRGLTPKVKRPHEATVAVTPLGLAVIQGDVRGEARWDEIRDVRMQSKPPKLALTSRGLTTGVDVVLAGATVRILDIYDRPIHEIHERIVAYWK